MKVLVSGSHGLVAGALMRAAGGQGHTFGRLLRPGSVPQGGTGGDVFWDPVSGEFDAAAAEGADAVVHLAGASVGEGRWTEERKKVLRSSRVDATQHLVRALAQLRQPPKVFVCASATGYYGDRGDEVLTETSAPGNDFIAGLAKDWEAAALGAERFGARVVILRFGIVLSPNGGALPRMLKPFRMGVGGRLGSGKQWMSWVALDDVIGVVWYALENVGLRGPVNVVAPNPVQNAEFTRVLARVLHRPALFPAPRFALRAALGEMADVLLFSSQRAVPEKLTKLGYPFRHGGLEEALRAALAARE
jgi:uncharacterized protein (TIGR01777 family)